MTRTALYRHYDDEGQLLYVGISENVESRTRMHVRRAPWFELVKTSTIAWFDTRGDALSAERAAIKDESPRFNVVHNPNEPQGRLRASSIGPMTPPTLVVADPGPLLDPVQLRNVMSNWHRECGAEIRRRRIECGWTQEQLAGLAGITTMSISRFEAGTQSPPDSVRLAIACSLNCEINDIWPPLNTRFAMAICRPVVAA